MRLHLTCSSCGNQDTLELVRSTRGAAQLAREDLNDGTRAKIVEFLKEVDPGDYPSRVLYARFGDWAADKQVRPPSIQTFSRATAALGCTHWRTATGRFVSVPPLRVREPESESGMMTS